MSVNWTKWNGDYSYDQTIGHMAAYGHIDTWINNEQLVSDVLVVYQKIGHIGTYMHMSSQWTTCIGGFSFYSNHSIWGHISIYRHMSTQWTTSLRGCSCVSNHWPNGRNGHIPSQEFTVDNTYWRLWLCLQPVPTWGHMGTYLHLKSKTGYGTHSSILVAFIISFD